MTAETVDMRNKAHGSRVVLPDKHEAAITYPDSDYV